MVYEKVISEQDRKYISVNKIYNFLESKIGNELKENVVKEVEEDVKEKEEVLVEANVEKNINEAIAKEEPDKEENIEKTEEVIEEVKEELEKPLEEEILEIKEENKEVDVINPIEAYEQEQREVEREQAEYARAVAEQKERKINALKQKHIDGYWEYKVLSLMDEQTGGINPSSIEGSLNELALDGWHLKCAFTNELGQNTSSSGFGGITTGTNATIDQNILILERYIKI